MSHVRFKGLKRVSEGRERQSFKMTLTVRGRLYPISSFREAIRGRSRWREVLGVKPCECLTCDLPMNDPRWNVKNACGTMNILLREN